MRIGCGWGEDEDGTGHGNEGGESVGGVRMGRGWGGGVVGVEWG